MANRKIVTIVLAAITMMVAGRQIAQGQCNVSVTIGNITVDPCSPQRVSIPVFMNNPCPVGGFEFHIVTTQRAWLHFTPSDPACADTIGSRISNWEMFSGNVHSYADSQIIVTGIADMPGGGDSISLPPGNGLIFTIHLEFYDNNVCSTSQLIDFTLGHISDPSGYILYSNQLTPDFFYVLPGNCYDSPRGDVNCSGQLNGLDVLYLVTFLKGQGPSYCCLCTGDANNSNSVNGLDVTYLVGYFKGANPPPAPCR